MSHRVCGFDLGILERFSQRMNFVYKSVMFCGDFVMFSGKYGTSCLELGDFFFPLSIFFPGVGDLIICGRAVTSEEFPKLWVLFEMALEGEGVIVCHKAKDGAVVAIILGYPDLRWHFERKYSGGRG